MRGSLVARRPEPALAPEMQPPTRVSRMDHQGLRPDRPGGPPADRHTAVASLPSVTYGLPLEEVEAAARDGYFVIKLKLGHPGSQQEMLERDMDRFTRIHQAVGALQTPHTSDGKIRYDLDPNSRYESKETLLRLLDHARRIGAFEQIVGQAQLGGGVDGVHRILLSPSGVVLLKYIHTNYSIPQPC